LTRSLTEATTLAAAAARPSTLRLIIACIACSILGDMLIWLRPAVTAEYLNQRGITNAIAGFIGTTELVVLALTMLIWTRYAGSVRYRTMGLLGVVMAAAGAFGAMFVSDIPALVVSRGVAAVGFGLLMLVPATAGARLPNAQSAYGGIFATSMMCNAAALSLLPWIGATFDRPPGFVAFLLFATLLLPIILITPSDLRYGGGRSDDNSGTTPADARRRILFLACGYSAVALAYHAVWTFFVVMGEKSGLTADQASLVTALTAICAIVGSLASAPLTRIIGLRRAMRVVTVAFLLSMLLMMYTSLSNVFAIAGCLTIFFHFMMFPAILGSAAEIDPTGKGSGIVSASGWLVGAAGSYIGGLAIDLAGFFALGVLAAVMLIAALVLFGAAVTR